MGLLRPTARRLGAALALAALVAGSASAQEENDLPWLDSYFPYITSAPNDFPMFVVHYEQRKGADYFARTPYAGKAQVEVGSTLRGSRFAALDFRAPLLWRGWRLAANATASRDARFGFFGLGNDTGFDEDLVTDQQPFWYRARRTRYFLQGELTRRVRGPFSVAVAGMVEHSRLSALPLPSIFRNLAGNEETDTDANARLTLLFDTRDNEYNTHKGIFAEASVLGGSGGDGYSRITGIVRGYYPVREGTVLAARIAGSGTGGTPPLNALFEVPVWEGIIPVLGGAHSNRGYDYQRLAGEHVLFVNTEIRHDLLNLGDYGGFTLIAFFDAGRVFQNESFKLTTHDMKIGAGGGLAIRLLRSNIFTFNFAGGDDGFQFTTSSGWMF